MKEKILLLALALLPLAQAVSQTLTLDESLRLSRENYPLIRQYALTEAARDFTLENAAREWLPKVTLTAGAYGFTDVLKSNERMQMMGADLKNWLGNVGVSLQQNIYDGGRIKASADVQRAQAEAEQRQLDVSLYAVSERVEQLFFGTLVLEAQIAQCRVLEADLGVSRLTIESMLTHGTANQSDLDAVRVEQVKAVQRRESLETARRSYLSVLGVFVGRELGDSTRLERPSAEQPAVSEMPGVRRPEVESYAAQNRLLEAQLAQVNAKLRPTLSLFGGATFHNEVTSLANRGVVAGGVTLSWNFSAFYTRKNDISLIRTRQQQNDVMCRTFLFNTRMSDEQTNGNIVSLRKQIAHDDEIVELLQSIREKSERKVEQGLQSVNELLRDVNAVSAARQQRALHEIELLKETHALKLLNND